MYYGCTCALLLFFEFEHELVYKALHESSTSNYLYFYTLHYSCIYTFTFAGLLPTLRRRSEPDAGADLGALAP